jgi:outer membrane protein assembly factor BamB
VRGIIASASPPWWLVAVTALLLVACSAPDVDDGGNATPTTVAAPSTSTAPEGFPVVTADAVQEQRWRLPGGPDWLAVDDHGLWVKRDDGTVDRIAPDTGEIELTVEIGGDLCQGLGVGLGAVWSCSGSDVVRLDPRTGEVTATLAVDKTFSQGHLVTAAGQLWVLTGDGSTLTGVDPDTGTTVTRIPLATQATDLAVGDAGLWVFSNVDGHVLRIDPAGTVALRATGFDRPTAIAVTDQVWVGAVGGTSRIDPDTGEILAASTIGTGHGGSLAVGPDGVWVRSPRRFLVRLDPDTATPVAGISADVQSGGDIAVAFDSVWTTAFDDAVLFRLPIGSP